jgi:CheY-like chemotaxis protein
VDDRPDNNVYERQAFEAMGLTFTLALSTKQALDYLSRQPFAAVISDMGRREGPREGYVLLDTLRKNGNQNTAFFLRGF